jgi:hypothetical protein
MIQPTKGRHKAHRHADCPEHGQYCVTCNETCPICFLLTASDASPVRNATWGRWGGEPLAPKHRA